MRADVAGASLDGRPPTDRRGRLAAAALLVLAMAATVPVFVMFLKTPGINGFDSAMFLDTVYGRSDRPFVQRALVPIVVRNLAAVLPPATKDSVQAYLSELPQAQRVSEAFGWEQDALLEYGIAIAVMFSALVGFVFAVRALTRALYETTPAGSNLAALLAVIALPPLFGYYGYLYDFPALLLFTCGLTLLATRRWGAFLVVYLLGAINKETIVLLSLVFLVYDNPFATAPLLPRRTFAALLAAQALVIIAVKTALIVIFRENAGGLVEFHADHTIEVLKGLLVPYSAVHVAAGLVLALLVFSRWHEKPRLLRQGLVILPVLLALTAFLGFINELRDYYEAYPLVVLLAFGNVAALAGIPATAREAD